MYEEIRLPRRATKGSAGYDFFAPYPITLAPGETVKNPDRHPCLDGGGMGAEMLSEKRPWVQVPPSAQQYGRIIDSDYYYSDNEGHIFAKLTNDTNEGKTVELKAGEGFMQGIFVEYGITLDDDADGIRNGGLGSTTK